MVGGGQEEERAIVSYPRRWAPYYALSGYGANAVVVE